jgi:hypothetical protein
MVEIEITLRENYQNKGIRTVAVSKVSITDLLKLEADKEWQPSEHQVFAVSSKG